ncbi:MAG: ammonia-forming cytochrome c nitrite reductase subunit c552, partial [Phycisphaerae bacterium]|nr:ammonia-forming cytochrome c nitrite reductase subunit c552 [Phycisphaerae bacterium]
MVATEVPARGPAGGTRRRRGGSSPHERSWICRGGGLDVASSRDVRQTLRRAQFRWDYISANNGMGFHSPQESTRILGEAANLAQQSRV